MSLRIIREELDRLLKEAPQGHGHYCQRCDQLLSAGHPNEDCWLRYGKSWFGSSGEGRPQGHKVAFADQTEKHKCEKRP
jgi:hypothetical protein